jgi:SAM-dependent methyltransferase
VTEPRHIAAYSPANVATEPDGRLFSPSFERNYEPIRDALRPHLAGRSGSVLEVGSGTGQHIAHLAGDFPGLTWVPSDISAQHHASIEAWRRHVGRANLAAPLFVDASADWAGMEAVRESGPLAGVLCCNVIHISPWTVAEGLARGAGRALAPGAALILYGPFREGGQHTAPSNASFDAGLRAENLDWGVRDLDEVVALARAAGLGPAQLTRMPSNNLLVAFARLSSG